jgi:hypothetical protein
MFALKLKNKNNDFIKRMYLPRNPNPSFYKPFRSEIVSKYRFREKQVDSPKSLEQNRLKKRILKTTKLCYEKNLTKSACWYPMNFVVQNEPKKRKFEF